MTDIQSKARWVVVDDTDSRIQYHGSSWFQQASHDNAGNLGPPYEGTLHGTQFSASLSFPFSGSRIIVTGTNNPLNLSGLIDPTWDCFVDNISIGPTPPSQGQSNNWVFCEQDNLVDGPHVISVNATVMEMQTFWFDSIRYLPSASVPLDNEAIYISHLDPALQFGPGWGPTAETATNMTIATGSKLTFSFFGESLSWYSSVAAGKAYRVLTAVGSYSVDDGAVMDFPLNTLALYSDFVLSNQKIFETPSYPAGVHTIVVTFLGNSSTPPLMLDHLVVQNGTSGSKDSPSAPSSIGGVTAGTSTTSAGAPSPTGGTIVNSHSSDIGAIIGGVVGGIVLAAVAIVALVYLRRWKKRKNAASRSGDDESDGDIIVEPFLGATTLPPNVTGFGHTQHHSFQISRTGKPTEHGPQPAPTTININPVLLAGLASPPRKRRLEAEAATTTGSQTTPLTPPKSTTLATGTSHVIHHEDSGVRLPTGVPEDEVLELPPIYTPA